MKPVIIPIEQQLYRYTSEEQGQLQQALDIVKALPEDNSTTYRPNSLETAAILIDFHVDLRTILAAILSDYRLANLPQPPNIAAMFGKIVEGLIKDVNWLNQFRLYSLEMSNQPQQTEMLRRMILSMTKDVRAILIKLAYRIQRLRNLPTESHDIRRFIAQETLDIYAPIANRLGIHQFKWELEDMAFRYLDPVTYKQIAQSLATNRVARENGIKNFITTLRHAMAKENINCHCYGRPKHIYSIYKKMQNKNLNFNQLFDLLAVRVVVDSLTHCYTVLGIVHSLWQTIPKEFDDYIANPKENGYESLHTVILDENLNHIEVQIRTKAMHDYAELGVAAHWSYKEGGRQSPTIEKSIAILRQLLESKEDNSLSVDQFHSELFSDSVYVLTPLGLIIDLIKGSTPLDFAYAIHTEIGHRCRGAKVNSRIVPLTYQLNSGERVEILTTKEIAPNRNWIAPNSGYLKSPRAIQKIKHWFQLQSRQLAQSESEKSKSNLLPEIRKDKPINVYPNKKLNQCEVAVTGLSNIQTSFAKCCRPVEGDAIIGYISSHKGIIVHQCNCENILLLQEEKRSHLVSVTWQNIANSDDHSECEKCDSTNDCDNKHFVKSPNQAMAFQ